MHAFLIELFPSGRILGGNGPDELAAEIASSAAHPVSFTARIDFLNADSNRFSVFASGIADQCILSTQPFLYHNECAIRERKLEEKQLRRLGSTRRSCSTQHSK